VGPKFKNGDTLLAKITPCLENGKTAFVDILDENEIAFGSSEFIVLRAIKNISDANYIYYLARSPKFRNRAIYLNFYLSLCHRLKLNKFVKKIYKL